MQPPSTYEPTLNLLRYHGVPSEKIAKCMIGVLGLRALRLQGCPVYGFADSGLHKAFWFKALGLWGSRLKVL